MIDIRPRPVPSAEEDVTMHEDRVPDAAHNKPDTDEPDFEILQEEEKKEDE